MQGNNVSVRYGALEAGGTKFVCAVTDADAKILAETRLPTQDPASTLNATCQFFREAFSSWGAPAALGVASFGPVELNKNSPHYGHIGKTPKVGWSHTDIAGVLKREFGCPVGFDTDVNAAALAENRWGAGQDVDNLVYVTVGTGIGAGIIVNGAPIHGLMHPEIGHIYPRRHPADGDFKGVCPFHGDCLEGLASGPAIVARWGLELASLPPAHPQWDIEADYLGQLCAQLTATVSPQRIVLGGGVMSHPRLFAAIRERLKHWLGSYIDRAEVLTDTEHFVVPPALAHRSGVLGAVVLAQTAA
ncbi:MAG TPA: ROK family protein [Steroidobacteraceae bacterium]|jgi:fructokinase